MATALKLMVPEQPNLPYPLPARDRLAMRRYRAAKRRKAKEVRARAAVISSLAQEIYSVVRKMDGTKDTSALHKLGTELRLLLIRYSTAAVPVAD